MVSASAFASDSDVETCTTSFLRSAFPVVLAASFDTVSDGSAHVLVRLASLAPSWLAPPGPYCFGRCRCTEPQVLARRWDCSFACCWVCSSFPVVRVSSFPTIRVFSSCSFRLMPSSSLSELSSTLLSLPPPRARGWVLRSLSGRVCRRSRCACPGAARGAVLLQSVSHLPSNTEQKRPSITARVLRFIPCLRVRDTGGRCPW